MKLSEVRALIRKTQGNPSCTIDLGNGVPMTVTLQKTPLLEALGKAFNDERTAETGLTLDAETNTLMADGVVGETPNAETAAAIEDSRDGNVERAADLDDVFGDDEDDDLL